MAGIAEREVVDTQVLAVEGRGAAGGGEVGREAAESEGASVAEGAAGELPSPFLELRRL